MSDAVHDWIIRRYLDALTTELERRSCAASLTETRHAR